MNFDQGKMFNLMQILIIQSTAAVSLMSVQTYGEDFFEQSPSIYEEYQMQLETTEILIIYEYPEDKQLQQFLSDPLLTDKYIIMEIKEDEERQQTIFKVKKK